jgi:hypothetical protein
MGLIAAKSLPAGTYVRRHYSFGLPLSNLILENTCHFIVNCYKQVNGVTDRLRPIITIFYMPGN